MEPILEVKDVTKTFSQKGRPDFHAIENVNFSLYQGDILGIVGESGSGKSTLAKLITKLIPPTKGEIIIQGQNIQTANHAKMKEIYGEIQMVFQNPSGSFDPRKTLGYGIGESLRNRRMKKEEISTKVAELLVQCGLSPEFASRYPHEVSGGQCQRAAIARALAVNPSILICDEATSALDVTVQKQILQLLRELQKTKKVAILFICHNLALVQEFCNRVLVLYDGKIIEQGKPDDVILSPQSEYTKKLVDSIL